MGRKLPVVETAIDGLLFGLGNVWTILRLGWAPILVFIIVGYGALRILCGGLPMEEVFVILGEAVEMAGQSASNADIERFIDARMASLEVDPAMALSSILGAGVLMVVGSLVFLPLLVALSRAAANREMPPRGFFYWQWGPAETRTFIAYLIVLAISCIATWGVGYLEATTISFVAGSGNAVLWWISHAVPIVATVLMLWISMRTLMIVPSTAVEGELNLGQALGATGGNVFRLIGSLILFLLLLLVSAIAACILLFVGNILISGVTLALGADATAAGIIGVITSAINVGIVVFTVLAISGAKIGWSARAWAGMRPDGVRVCSAGGPGDSEICAI